MPILYVSIFPFPSYSPFFVLCKPTNNIINAPRVLSSCFLRHHAYSLNPSLLFVYPVPIRSDPIQSEPTRQDSSCLLFGVESAWVCVCGSVFVDALVSVAAAEPLCICVYYPFYCVFSRRSRQGMQNVKFSSITPIVRRKGHPIRWASQSRSTSTLQIPVWIWNKLLNYVRFSGTIQNMFR